MEEHRGRTLLIATAIAGLLLVVPVACVLRHYSAADNATYPLMKGYTDPDEAKRHGDHGYDRHDFPRD